MLSVSLTLVVRDNKSDYGKNISNVRVESYHSHVNMFFSDPAIDFGPSNKIF